MRFRLVLLLLAALSFRAPAQEVHLKFNVQGPGAVITCCPEPNQVGQGYLLLAQPLPNARFMQWEDGSTSPERSFIVRADKTEFTAYFEDIPQVPYLVLHGLQEIDPARRTVAEFAQDGGRLRLSFVLPGRHGYRLLGTTNLLTTLFEPVPFAPAPAAAADLVENFGEAGPVSLWLDAQTNAPARFFKVALDNQLTLPAIYFAQASIVHPGDTVTLYGDNLDGTVEAFAGSTALATSSLDAQSLRVTMPSAPGAYLVSVKVNAKPALGAVTIRVSNNPADFPAVSGVANMKVTAGGVVEVAGTGFTTGMEAFLDGKPAQIASVATNGTSLVVRVPASATGNRVLTLVKNGALSAAINVNIAGNDLGYAPATTRGVRLYTWEPYQPNAYSFTPATPQGVRVYSWEPYQPGAYSFTPATAQGVRVFTWEPYQPGSFSYLPATARGALLFTWEPYQPGTYSYLPATIRGVRVYAP